VACSGEAESSSGSVGIDFSDQDDEDLSGTYRLSAQLCLAIRRVVPEGDGELLLREVEQERDVRVGGRPRAAEEPTRRFKNAGGDWTGWSPYEQRKAWRLSVGEGNKRVYVQYKDLMGNVSDPVSDAIAYRP
jgi:hypothetical protein